MATPEEVRKLAALARIEVTEAELESFTKEFDGVLRYIGQLEELSLTGEAAQAGAVRNVMRPDDDPHAAGLHTDALTEQFPAREGDALKVKQIISYE